MAYKDLVKALWDSELEEGNIDKKEINNNINRLLDRDFGLILKMTYGLEGYQKCYTPEEIVKELGEDIQPSTIEIVANMALNQLRAKLVDETMDNAGYIKNKKLFQIFLF